MLMPDQLERYRAAVDDGKTGAQIESIVAAARAKGLEVSAHEALKTAPRGYPKDHPRIDLLRQKGLITWKQWPVAAWLGTAQAKKRIVDVFAEAKPMNTWLDKHVGPIHHGQLTAGAADPFSPFLAALPVPCAGKAAKTVERYFRPVG